MMSFSHDYILGISCNLSTIGGRYETTTCTIHTEYIQIDQLLKLEGVIETGGQVKGLIDDQVLTLNGTIVTEKRKKCRVGDVIGVEGLDVEFIVTKEEA